jgi:hypothetical protein
MKKLRLNVDDLNVAGFEVQSETRDADGTVLAMSGTLYTTTYPIRYCPNMPNISYDAC